MSFSIRRVAACLAAVLPLPPSPSASRNAAPALGPLIRPERSEGADPMGYRPSRGGRRAPTRVDAVTKTIEIGRRSGVPTAAPPIKPRGVRDRAPSSDRVPSTP